MREIIFRNLRAIDNPTESLDFQKKHIDLLRSKGIKLVDSTNESWLDNPSVYLMALYSDGELMAGARVHTYNPDYDYPCINALKKVEHRYLDLSALTGSYLHGEGCGIWVSDELRGYGMLEVVTYGAIAIAWSLGLDNVFGFGPRHTLGTFRRAGFRPLEHDGHVFQFEYPSPEFKSTIVGCPSRPETYPIPREKSRIYDWMSEESYSYIHKGPSGECQLQLSPFPTKDPIIEANRGREVENTQVLRAI